MGFDESEILLQVVVLLIEEIKVVETGVALLYARLTQRVSKVNYVAERNPNFFLGRETMSHSIHQYAKLLDRPVGHARSGIKY